LLNLGQLWRKIAISLIFCALVFICLSFYANFSDLKEAFFQFSPWYLLILLLLSFCNYIVRFVKWDYYIRILDIQLTRSQSFSVFLAGLIMSISPGKFGEVLKSFLVKSINGTPISKSAPVVLAERLTDFMGLIVLVMLGLSSSQASIEIVVVSVLIVTIILGLLSSRRFSLALLAKIEHLIAKVFQESKDPEATIREEASLGFGGKLKNVIRIFPQKMHVAYESISSLLTVKRLIWTTILSVLSWSFEGCAFVLLIHAFGFDITLTEGIFIYSFSIILGALTMLPGGVGLTETSLSGLLILKGFPKSISVAVTLIIRITTLWFAVAIGALVLSSLVRKIPENSSMVSEKMV